MALRFRKSIRLAPGIRLNVSLGGLSVTLGGAPLSLNLSRKGVRGTASLPGTGLSATTQLAQFSPPGDSPATVTPAGANDAKQARGCGVAMILAIFAALAAWLASGPGGAPTPPPAPPPVIQPATTPPAPAAPGDPPAKSHRAHQPTASDRQGRRQ